MNKSPSYDDEETFSSQGLLTIKLLPSELMELQSTIETGSRPTKTDALELVQLREENARLKGCLDNMRECAGEEANLQDYFNHKIGSSWEYELEEQRMKKEIQTLKDENARYDQQIEKCRDGSYRPSFEASVFNEGAYFGRECGIKEMEKKISELEDEIEFLKEDNKLLKEDVKGYAESISDYYDAATPLDIENVVEELEEEKKKLNRRATIYEYMSEFLEKADLYGAYFDYIREYYPDEREEAGDVVSDDEED